MAEQRVPTRRRARRAIIATAAAAGIASTLVLGHAINQTAASLDVHPTATVLGLGGNGDSTSANVPAKLSGKIGRGLTTPAAGSYRGISYPADFNFQASTDAGAATLKTEIDTAPGGGIRVVGYSEGTLVAEAVKRRYAADPRTAPDPAEVSFLFIASPYLPNGGLFARFPGFRIPGLLPEFGPAAPTPYNQTFVTNEYDTYADFPAYFNPLSIANALLATRYVHPDPFYDRVDPDELPAGSRVTTVPKANGGSDTYILVYATHLPLLAPIREVAGLLSLTPLTEPVLAGIEPVLRLVIDAGYTDRTYANPAQPKPFSLITPPGKIVEAAVGVPDSPRAGAAGAVSGGAGPIARVPEAGIDRHVRPAAASEPIENVVPAVGPEPVDHEAARITHPTVTSAGNTSRPTTTVSGDPPAGSDTAKTVASPPDPPSSAASTTLPSEANAPTVDAANPDQPDSQNEAA